MATENEEKTGPVEDTQGEATPQEGQHAADPLAEAKAEAARMKEMWMRSAADFDNFRKRARKEVDDARRGGREDLLKELLPVFDNLERGVQSAQRATDVKAVSDGLAMILKQFECTLSRVGIRCVAITGVAFDPAKHKTMQQGVSNDQPAQIVVAEVQAGYKQDERLVRAAMVVVAKPKSTPTADGTN